MTDVSDSVLTRNQKQSAALLNYISLHCCEKCTQVFWNNWLLIPKRLQVIDVLPQIQFSLDVCHWFILGIVTPVSIVHTEALIKTTAEQLWANITSWLLASEIHYAPSEYTDLTGTVWFSLVSTDGVGWRVEDGLQWFPGKAPQGYRPLFTQSAPFHADIDKLQFQTAGWTSLGVYVCLLDFVTLKYSI